MQDNAEKIGYFALKCYLFPITSTLVWVKFSKILL